MDPYKELAGILKQEMNRSAGQALLGVPSVLGIMTATGVLLDDFKHEIKDPLVLESVVDIDIEMQLKVPAHLEKGKLVIENNSDVRVTADGDPAGPTVGYIMKGEQPIAIRFDPWDYDASSLGKIEAKQVRVKFKPEYKPGDRVVCVLINGGQDVVIISRVVPYA